jgi:hypothetical protein
VLKDNIMSVADAVIELVKLVGGLGGIASSSFLIYDRLWRLRPIPYLRPHDSHVHLKIRNTANEALVIDKIDVSPKVLGIVMKERKGDLLSQMDATANAVYDAQTGGSTFAVIPPLEEGSFRLIELPACSALKDDERVLIRCDWRSTRRPWPFTRSVSVMTTPKDLKSYVIVSGKFDP